MDECDERMREREGVWVLLFCRVGTDNSPVFLIFWIGLDWIGTCTMFTITRESQEPTSSRPTLPPLSAPPPAPSTSPAPSASPAPSPPPAPPTTTIHPNPDLDAKRTLQALMDDASPHSSHCSTTIPIPSDTPSHLATSTTAIPTATTTATTTATATDSSTSFSSISNTIAPDVPVAVLTIDDQDVTLLADHSLNKHRNRLLSCKATQASSKKGFRTIRFTSPSRRRRRRRLVHGATVEQSVQSMDMEALRALLIQHGLVQRGTTAPLDVLRDIARGVFQTD